MSLLYPFSRDNRIILRRYAWILGILGTLLNLFGWDWFEHDLPGLPFGMESLVRVSGTLLFASGCWAASISQTGDPHLRRNSFRWFVAAHAAVLLILHLQGEAIWPPVVTSKIEFWITPLFCALLLMFGHSESAFLDRDTGLPMIPAGDGSVRTLYERQIREAGAQEERNRLARDLHDSIKQQIFVIRTAAATAQARFDDDRTGAALALDQIRESARDAMTEMEVMIDYLRAVPLENTTLIAALKKQCEALGHRTGAHVELTVGELPANETLAPGAHQTILRVAQEACANIGRHARASNVTVSLGSIQRTITLRIQDDGLGIRPLTGSPGLGIVNMQARAKESDGEFHLTSSPGNGTTIIFSLPCNTRILPSHRTEYVQQALIYLAMFAVVMVFNDTRRTFTLLAWGFFGIARAWQLMSTHRRAARASQ